MKVNAARRIRPWLAGACFASLLAACQATGRGGDVEVDTRPAWEHKIQIEHRLQGGLVVENAVEDHRGDLLFVQVTLRNDVAATRTFRYRFEWFDANGVKVRNASESWQRVEIRGGERQYLQGVSPDPAAVDWRFVVQDWKN